MKTQTYLTFDCARHCVGLARFAGKHLAGNRATARGKKTLQWPRTRSNIAWRKRLGHTQSDAIGRLLLTRKRRAREWNAND